VQQSKCLARDRLIVLVVAHHRTTGVGRKNLGRKEMLPRERALARTARADQHDEREFGDGNCAHLARMALIRTYFSRWVNCLLAVETN